MIPAQIKQFERGAAERDDALAVDCLVGDDDVRRFQRLDAILGIAMRDEGCAKILEG